MAGDQERATGGDKRRLRILAGAPFVPSPPTTYSNQVVVAKLAAMARNHDVVFLCSVSSAEERSALERVARETGIEAHGITAPNSRGRMARVLTHALCQAEGCLTGVPPSVLKSGHAPLRRELAAEAASGRFDLVQIDYWYVARGWIRSCRVPSVCYVHDLMFERVVRAEAFAGGTRRGAVLRDGPWASRRLREREIETLEGFSALAAISPRDAGVLAGLVPAARVAAMPAGVDLTRLTPVSRPSEPESVLFVGALGSGPNEDGAWALARFVWPHVLARSPRARLYIVGRDPSARIRAMDGRDGIRVVGNVSDVRGWYERCAVVVSSLRWGSGMKGKVLEAMALGRPLVASAVSMEGISAKDREHYLAAETPREFAAAVHRLFAHPDEGGQLAVAARRYVEATFDAALCLSSYVDFIEEVADA